MNFFSENLSRVDQSPGKPRFFLFILFARLDLRAGKEKSIFLVIVFLNKQYILFFASVLNIRSIYNNEVIKTLKGKPTLFLNGF